MVKQFNRHPTLIFLDYSGVDTKVDTVDFVGKTITLDIREPGGASNGELISRNVLYTIRQVDHDWWGGTQKSLYLFLADVLAEYRRYSLVTVDEYEYSGPVPFWLSYTPTTATEAHGTIVALVDEKYNNAINDYNAVLSIGETDWLSVVPQVVHIEGGSTVVDDPQPAPNYAVAAFFGGMATSLLLNQG